MVKSFAHESEGGWLSAQAAASLPTHYHDFKRAVGPPQEQAQASDHAYKSRQSRSRRYSRPEPVLKPRSQQGRRPAPGGTEHDNRRDNNAPWLETQWQQVRQSADQAALNNQYETARIAENFNAQTPSETPGQTPGQTPTQSPGHSRIL